MRLFIYSTKMLDFQERRVWTINNSHWNNKKSPKYIIPGRLLQDFQAKQAFLTEKVPVRGVKISHNIRM
jgi:hypothetical protein